MKSKVRHQKFWLIKTEPDVYSIDDLARDRSTSWDGVRNYQARNFIRDEMKVGDLVFIYHSNANPSGIAGLATVSRQAEPDRSQFDRTSDFFDPKARIAEPTWYSVTVDFKEKFRSLISLQSLQKRSMLGHMLLLQKGQRLSVQPVDGKAFETIMAMAKERSISTGADVGIEASRASKASTGKGFEYK